MKRKCNEHRSLDSILLEDEDELEYFDVLNLLPLSKVRLEFDESDARSNSVNNFGNNSNFGSCGSQSRKVPSTTNNEIVTSSEHDASEETEESDISECVEITEICENDKSKFGKNFTDEEKCKSQPKKEYPEIVEFHERRDSKNSWRSFTSFSQQQPIDRDVIISRESNPRDFVPREVKKVESILESPLTSETDSGSASGKDNKCKVERKEDTDEPALVTTLKEIATRNRVEEAEDYKSIWISDTEEPDEMSRRPQVLKVVDNEVTRKRGRSFDTSLSKDRHPVQIKNESHAESRQMNPFSEKKIGQLDENEKLEVVKKFFKFNSCVYWY